MNLKLRTRIGLGYGLVIATLVAVLCVLLLFMQVLRDQNARINEGAVPSIRAANTLLLIVEQMENLEFRYFTDGARRPALYTQFDQYYADFQNTFETLEASVHTPEERRLLTQIGHRMGSLAHIDEQMRALIARGRLAQAALLNNTESSAQADKLRAAMRDYRDIHQQAIVALQHRQDDMVGATAAVALGIALFGLVLAAAMWRHTSRAIATPLATLQDNFESLARGAYTPRPAAAAIPPTAELNALQASFDHMAFQLASVTDDLQAANSALEAQVDARTAELRTANAALARHVEELKALDSLKSNFMAVISHELLTPINFITGYGSALEDQLLGPLTPEQQRAVSRMLEGANRLTRMVRNVLDYTQLESGALAIRPGEADAAGPVRQAVDALRPEAESRHVGLELRLPEGPVPAWIDPSRLEQALYELVDNAIKFTAEGGRVLVSLVKDAQGATVTVADTGVGIAPEVVPTLFRGFQQGDSSRTRRHGGLGLGLALSGTLIDRMGGSVHVTSQLGAGATFTVRLSRTPGACKLEAPWRLSREA